MESFVNDSFDMSTRYAPSSRSKARGTITLEQAIKRCVTQERFRQMLEDVVADGYDTVDQNGVHAVTCNNLGIACNTYDIDRFFRRNAPHGRFRVPIDALVAKIFQNELLTLPKANDSNANSEDCATDCAASVPHPPVLPGSQKTSRRPSPPPNAVALS